MIINNQTTLKAAKSLGMKQNVTLRVIDEATGKVVQEHVGHNTVTNSMLTGIAHYLTGDGVFEQGYHMLSAYVPRYISLGTMGLITQHADMEGLPAGIGSSIPDGADTSALDEAQAALIAAEKKLASFCPYFLETGKCYTGEECSECSGRLELLRNAVDDARDAYERAYEDLVGQAGSEEERFKQYMSERPGYGADGYDVNQNNNRRWMGIGKVFKDRPTPGRTINCELISASFPRAQISFRDVVPEVEAELPKTIDVVFSALISTGALKQFRESGRDYIFITETGLWSQPDWPMSVDMSTSPDYKWDEQTRDYECGDNGLLAAYRLAPPNEVDWDMTVPENRKKLKQNILRVGVNQVVQVVWKIQLGSIDQFGGLDVLKG